MIALFSVYKKYSSYIALFLLFVAMGLTVWIGIVPLERTITEKMHGIQEFYAGQENRQKQVARLPELKDQYTTIVTHESSLNIVMNEKQIVDFIKTLEGLARDMHVEMTIASQEGGQIIEPKKTTPDVAPVSSADQTAPTPAPAPAAKVKVVNIVDDVPFGRYLHLSIKAAGQYADIVSFLAKIEMLPVGLDVIGLDAHRVDAATQGVSSSPRAPGNPFTFLGSGVPVAQPSGVPLTAAKNSLEATFDVLVYVNK